MDDQVFTILITAIVTGIVQTIGTVIALKIHIDYLRKQADHNQEETRRAHSRIDKIELGGCALFGNELIRAQRGDKCH